MSDSVWPNQNSRKFRWRCRVRNGFRDAGTDGMYWVRAARARRAAPRRS